MRSDKDRAIEQAEADAAAAQAEADYQAEWAEQMWREHEALDHADGQQCETLTCPFNDLRYIVERRRAEAAYQPNKE